MKNSGTNTVVNSEVAHIFFVPSNGDYMQSLDAFSLCLEVGGP